MNHDSPRSKFSRREFGALAGAGLAALALPGGLRAAETPLIGGFRLGMQSYSLRGFGFEVALEKIKELGLHYVELFPGHLSHQGTPPSKIAAAKEKMASLGITADSYGVVPFSKKDEKGARKIFEFAKDLKLIAISADPEPDSFDMLDTLVEEFKIPIAIHNHGPGSSWEFPEKIHAAVKDHHALIGICCDCGHYLRSGVDPVDAIKVLKGRVFGFHIKDFVDAESEKVAGDGKLNIAALLKEARAQNFKGACSVEYELDPKDPMEGLKKGVENFKKAAAA